MIETMIALKNKLEPTLILQSVNDVTNCKRNQKGKQFFFCSFYKVYAANPTRFESRDQTNSRDQGSSFATILGSGIKIYGLNVGSFGKKVYLITTLIFANYKVFSIKELILQQRNYLAVLQMTKSLLHVKSQRQKD